MFSPASSEADSTADMFEDFLPDPEAPAGPPSPDSDPVVALPNTAPSARGQTLLQGQVRGQEETDLGGQSQRSVQIGDKCGSLRLPPSEVTSERPGPVPSARGRTQVRGLGQVRGRQETDRGSRSRRSVHIGDKCGPLGPPPSEVNDELYYSGRI
jgi:hypothetical protein